VFGNGSSGGGGYTGAGGEFIQTAPPVSLRSQG
jgi:hypothetical protein